MTIVRKYDLALRPQPVETDHDYFDVPNDMELSEFKSLAISYIAGYVVRMVQKKNALFKMFGCVDKHEREHSRPVRGVEIKWWS